MTHHLRRYARSGRQSSGCYTLAVVANIKSQIKRNRQNEKRRTRNRSTRTALKTHSKRVDAAVESGDRDVTTEELRKASRALDKAVSSGAIHKNTAARRKSRLAQSAASASSGS